MEQRHLRKPTASSTSDEQRVRQQNKSQAQHQQAEQGRPTQNRPTQPQNRSAPAQKPARTKVPAKTARPQKPSKKSILKEEVRSLINPDAVRPNDIIRVRGGVDRPMLTIILLLVCFGSAMVFSASYAYALHRFDNSYYFIRNQLVYVAVGLAAMFVVSLIDYRWVRRLSLPYFLFVLLLLLLIFVPGLGVTSGAARRWLYIPGVTTIQPSEFMKLGLVLMLALYYQFVEKKVEDKRFFVSSVFGTFAPAAIVGLVCLLIALEKHVSGTIIMFAIGVLVIFCGGGKPIWLLGAGGTFAAVIGTIIAATGYATKRVDIWLHPENYSEQSEVWQTLQGLYAVGSGGMLGVGLGESRQKHLFVSQPQNDFIYSIICEELGFVGAVLVILLFGVFIWRGFVIAMKAPDTFSRLAVIGIVGKVGIQAMLNIAVVTGSIPNTGITLPFFSYGGSSLSVLLVEMGIVLSISRYSVEQK